jgi:hydrogenase maturation protein HypF
MGGDLKNAFCLAAGDSAHLAPHIGDLENASTHEHLIRSVARLERLLDIHPEVVAHDLHPGYFSTRYALERASVRHVGVQHHHAHVASCMGEHGLEGRAIGVAFDGTGYGLDGNSWGGEILIAGYRSFERVATLRPLALPGGEQAILQPWRTALAALEDAFEGDPPLEQLSLFRGESEERVEAVRQLIRRRIQTPLSHGCGRWFDAVGALLLGRGESHYEGQIPMGLNVIADERERGTYPFMIDQANDPWQLDLRPTLRALVDELIAGQSVGLIAARFHNALVAGSVALVRGAAERVGALPVVLSGGSFQNPLLAAGVEAALDNDFAVYRHREVPPGDGGLALGQALVADALSRE